MRVGQLRALPQVNAIRQSALALQQEAVEAHVVCPDGMHELAMLIELCEETDEGHLIEFMPVAAMIVKAASRSFEQSGYPEYTNSLKTLFLEKLMPRTLN